MKMKLRFQIVTRQVERKAPSSNCNCKSEAKFQIRVVITNYKRNFELEL